MTPTASQRDELDRRVMEFITKKRGTWFRVVDIANALNVAVVVANNSLRRLHSGRDIEREDRQKRKQGRWKGRTYPVYRVTGTFNAIFPAWMSPRVPRFKKKQILGNRVVRVSVEDGKKDGE